MAAHGDAAGAGDPRRLIRLLGLAAGAVAWAVAAALLWPTDVPELDLPPVDVAAELGRATVERAQSYSRFLRFEFLVSQAVLLAVLALYARRGARLTRESAAGPIGTGMLLGMLGLGLVWLAQLPFRFVEVWWDRRYGLTDVGYVEAAFANWAELGAEFLFVSFALLVVMGFARRWPRGWWLPAAPVFVALGALFTFVYPYFAIEPRPLRDPELVAATREYARAQGVEDVPVRVEKVSHLTEQPNAYAVGLGPTRTVFLWDTLTDGRFSDDEVKVVIAHELAHHSRNHLPEGLAWYALLAFPGTWLIALATRRRGGMANPRAVPYGLLALVVLSLAALPLENGISRRMEAEADWVALETSREPRAAEELFAKFTTIALSDPDPPGWERFLLGSHPSLEERIAMARAWASR